MASPDKNIWLGPYLEVQRAQDAQLQTAFQEAAQDIAKRILRLGHGVGANVRRAQLQLALNEIKTRQQTTWRRDVWGNITDGRTLARIAAQEAAETLDDVIYASVSEPVADSLTASMRVTASAGIEADAVRVPRDLSSRVYYGEALATGQVETTIRAGIQAGLSARELSENVYQFITPTTPGGPAASALRLARTEINNAYHEQQIKSAERPGITAVRWNLSGSHPRPDACNDYAVKNAFRLGAGCYPPSGVPGKPHPNCLCYLSYEMLEPEAMREAILRGDFDRAWTQGRMDG